MLLIKAVTFTFMLFWQSLLVELARNWPAEAEVLEATLWITTYDIQLCQRGLHAYYIHWEQISASLEIGVSITYGISA